MDVKVIRATEKPEQLVCQAARGDYFDGYVGDTEYEELMESVQHDEQDVEAVQEYISQNGADWIDEHMSGPVETAAKTKSFIEGQLSRGHYGPWEHPSITFTVKGVSRVTMAQITRHRHMTFDVQSQRYVDFSDIDAIVPASILSRDQRIAQFPEIYEENEEHFSRESGLQEMDDDELKHWRASYMDMTSHALDQYEDMVEKGIPKEDARFILPLGTPVNMTFSGNSRTFMHLLDMRKKANAQWEIRALSERIIDELMDWMPYTYNHYEQNAPHKLSP